MFGRRVVSEELSRGGQTTARGPQATPESIFCSPRTLLNITCHSEKRICQFAQMYFPSNQRVMTFFLEPTCPHPVIRQC